MCCCHNLCHCSVTLISGKESPLNEHGGILIPIERKVKLFFHPFLDVVRERNHAHRLPDTEADTGGNTTVETFDSVLLVDEAESVEYRQLGGSVRVGSGLRHGLHLENEPWMSRSSFTQILKRLASTRTTSMGWFQVARAPPMLEEAIFSNALKLSLSDLP